MEEIETGLTAEELKDFTTAVSSTICEGGSEGFLG